MKRTLKLAVGMAVAAVLLWLFVRGIDATAVAASLRSANPAWLGGVLVFTLIHYVVRAWRWRLLLSPVRPDVPMRPLTEAILAGYAVTFLIPGRLGEVYRPVHLARSQNLPFAATLTTVGLDRILDALALAALLVAYLLLGPSSGPGSLPAEHSLALRRAGYGVGLSLVVLLPLLWLLASSKQRLARWKPGKGGRLRRHGEAIIQGLAVLKGVRPLSGAVAGSLVIWVVLSAQAWCGLRAFAIDLPFTSAFVLIAFLAMGIAVPSPAGVGGFHYFGRFCLVQMFGVATDPAVAAILVLHFLSVLPAMALGGWVLSRAGASLGDLFRRGPGESAAAPPLAFSSLRDGV